MDSNTKVIACFAVLLASMFFLSIMVIEQHQRNQNLQLLINDGWVNKTIAEAFPGFPVISYLGDVVNMAEELNRAILPNYAKIVVSLTDQHPEYFRWFTVSQREDNLGKHDPTNHYHIGFITSDLEVYDVGIDVGLQ
jgi:hypothetical protein